MLSVWEKESFISYDYLIIGSGIVGSLHRHINKRKDPAASIAVLERGILPSGASTKNAGFACFGSLTELLQDIKTIGPERTYQLASQRYNGLLKLRARLSDDAIDYQNHGGYELIRKEELPHLNDVESVNRLLSPIFSGLPFLIDNKLINKFGFNADSIKSVIYSPFEGQIDTGKMMKSLIKYATSKGISIITGAEVTGFEDDDNAVTVSVKDKVYDTTAFKAKKIAICTNAFTKKLLPQSDLSPGRGLVLITKPIDTLKVKGVFHMDQGYYYFRNFGNRLILGGARNFDKEAESTTEFGVNDKITTKLEETLKTDLLPDTSYDIDYYWSGIMAFGDHKEPVMLKHSENVYAGFRLGGMGVAIGTEIGENLADMMV